MKKVIVVLALLLVLSLTGCGDKELDYNDFSAYEAGSTEEIDNTEYDANFVYFYDSSEASEEVKTLILEFLNENEAVPYLLVDLDEVGYTLGTTVLNQPTMLVFGEGEVKEVFSGIEMLEFFVERYAQINSLDYKNFINSTMYSYYQMEHMEDNRYIAYYYSDSCGHCQEVKEEILTFFNGFDAMPVYMLDIADAPDQSAVEGFIGTPTLYVFSEGMIIDAFVGKDQVREFIAEYSELDYDNFQSQHITTFDEALSVDKEAYIIYYYLEGCPHCQAAKEEVLKWAMSRSISEVIFMNGAEVVNADNPPTELIILNSGTPILVVMTNGNFADEYYSGTEDVLNYIEQIGDGEITTDNYIE